MNLERHSRERPLRTRVNRILSGGSHRIKKEEGGQDETHTGGGR